MRETAYAKINLALHVRRRREDGYHELETLFAFVDAGDVLSAAPAAQDSLHVVGEFAATLASPLPAGEGPGVGAVPFDNLVARALGALPRPQSLAITLEKNLPVAAGLGGGSADAGAVFRMVEALHGLPDDWQARAAKLGADVPACVLSRTHIGLGTGTEQLAVEDDLAGTPVLLVNPRVPLSTGPVFKAWDRKDRGPLPGGPASKIAREGRNDLEAPAISLCPVIAEVLAALQATAPWLARHVRLGRDLLCALCHARSARRGSGGHAARMVDHGRAAQVSYPTPVRPELVEGLSLLLANVRKRRKAVLRQAQHERGEGV